MKSNKEQEFQPKVLGQILLMQSVISGLPDEASIFSFVCRGLSDLPGVKRVSHSYKPIKQKSSDLTVKYKIIINDSNYGELVLTLSDKKAFSPYHDYLENFCFMLAVILDEREKSVLLEDLNHSLEEKIEERTAALQESEDQLNQIFNSTIDAILVADKNTRQFMTSNKSSSRLLGYTVDEITSLKIDDIHPEEEFPEIKKWFYKLANQEADIAPNIPVKRKDGSIFYADIAAAPTIINGNECVIGIFRDVTERRKNEEKAQQEDKLALIGNFASGIAHDFNNILSGIMGYTDLVLHNDSLDSNSKNNLNEVMKASNTARELIKQLLTFSHKSPIDKKAFQISETVNDIVGLLKSTLPANIKINKEIEKNCSDIYGDPSQIYQVILNLCTNAIQSMEKNGGTVSISLEQISVTEKEILDLLPGSYLKMEIEDEGPGIDEETLIHIFDPYFTTKKMGKGTGLGLAVAKGAVEKHEGKIFCQSKLGEGTLFSIYIPIIT